MRSERRLAKLEAGLPPQAAVLHWLGQVHGHGSLDAYLDEPSARSPLLALADRVAAAARASHAREPRAMIREAERRATMDTVFLAMLALELEHEASEAIRMDDLRLGALRWELRARMAEGKHDREGWAAWRAGVLELATDLARTETARRALEARYLDGRETLSPAALATWGELREGVASLVESIPSVPGGGRRGRRPPSRAMRDAAERAAPGEAEALIARVRARALDLLGDHAGAARIVERALRGTA